MKNQTMKYTVLATAKVTDKQIDKLGIREFIYVSPATDKYTRTVSVMIAEDGGLGVTVTGHTASKQFVDQKLKHMIPSKKKELAVMAFAQDEAWTVGETFKAVPRDAVQIMVNNLLADKS